MGTRVLPFEPWACWALVGSIFGGSLGFWMIAPALGLRKARKLAGAIPIALLVVLTLSDVAISVMNDTNAGPVQTQAVGQPGTQPASPARTSP